MGFVKTLKNIYSIEDLRSRIFITLFFVVIYRLGTFIVLPGVDVNALQSSLTQAATGGNILGILNIFSGGAFAKASIFALGIMPYITASIIMQLAGIIIPSFQKLQREGESGRTKINQYTRYLTLVILVFQGGGYLYGAVGNAVIGGMNIWFVIQSTIILAAGSMFVLWLGERITDKGVGNGVSFIILVGIIARLPHALFAEFMSRLSQNGGLFMFIIEIAFLLLVICGAILLVQGTRRIPVQYAKRVVGNKQYGGARQYLPLKVNAANVMPIIFAQAIMFIPITVTGFATDSSGFARIFSDTSGLWYNLVFVFLIISFTWLYTAVTINPMQMADELKRGGGFIPGIKPGKDTANFIDSVMSRITLPGSLFLAIVATLPAIAIKLLDVSPEFAQFFGGTSLLILVGVVLDTLQQIESHLLMRHYDGLLKSGRIKGRQGSIAAY